VQHTETKLGHSKPQVYITRTSRDVDFEQRSTRLVSVLVDEKETLKETLKLASSRSDQEYWCDSCCLYRLRDRRGRFRHSFASVPYLVQKDPLCPPRYSANLDGMQNQVAVVQDAFDCNVQTGIEQIGRLIVDIEHKLETFQFSIGDFEHKLRQFV